MRAASLGLPATRTPVAFARAVIRRDRPFVLLDDARDGGAAPARLYRAPVADRRSAHAWPRCRPRSTGCARRGTGLHAAGFLSYEAAAAFEPVLGGLPPATRRCCGSACSSGMTRSRPATCRGLLPDPAAAWVGAPEPDVDRAGL